MNKNILKTLIKECYKEVLEENQDYSTKWDSMSIEAREEELLKSFKDPDIAKKYAGYSWGELPDNISDMVLNELNKHKKLKRTMNKSTLKSLIRECYKEVLAENEEMDISDITPRIYNNRGYGNTVAPMLQKLKSKLSPAGWQIITKFTQGHKEGGFNRPAILDRLAKADVTPISKGDIISYNNKILYGLIDTGDLIQDPVTKKYTLNTTLAENEEMDLPDTRKVYMGDEPSKIDLGVDKRMSSNIDKVKKQDRAVR
jgi:ribosomal protein S20